MIFINELEHAKEVLSSPNRIIVSFMARWCPICRMVNLTLEDFEEEFPNVEVYKLDSLQLKELAKEYNATAVPITYIIEKGSIVASHSGYLDLDALTNLYKN